MDFLAFLLNWTHQGEIIEKLMSSHMQFLLALEMS